MNAHTIALHNVDKPLSISERSSEEDWGLPRERKFWIQRAYGLKRQHQSFPGSPVCQPALQISDLPTPTIMGANSSKSVSLSYTHIHTYTHTHTYILSAYVYPHAAQASFPSITWVIDSGNILQSDSFPQPPHPKMQADSVAFLKCIMGISIILITVHLLPSCLKVWGLWAGMLKALGSQQP